MSSHVVLQGGVICVRDIHTLIILREDCKGKMSFLLEKDVIMAKNTMLYNQSEAGKRLF